MTACLPHLMVPSRQAGTLPEPSGISELCCCAGLSLPLLARSKLVAPGTNGKVLCCMT